jgi:hypothetical protein
MARTNHTRLKPVWMKSRIEAMVRMTNRILPKAERSESVTDAITRPPSSGRTGMRLKAFTRANQLAMPASTGRPVAR